MPHNRTGGVRSGWRSADRGKRGALRGVSWTGRRARATSIAAEHPQSRGAIGGRVERILREVPSASGGARGGDRLELLLERAASTCVLESERVLSEEPRRTLLFDLPRSARGGHQT